MSTYHRRKRRSKKRQREILRNRILFALIVLALLALIVFGVRALAQALGQGGTPAGSEAAASQAVSAVATPTPDPVQAAALAAQLQEQEWQQKSLEFFDWLKSQKDFSDLSLAATDGLPYLICVNRAASCVTVYTDNGQGEYTQPYCAMVCSGGSDTPTGIFNTIIRYDWRLLAGNVYGQYATRIYDCYLFHSVPYYSAHKDDLEYDEFNLLGTPASLGCIRLAVNDVKWVYDNCPLGTTVVIYDNADDPGPLGKPETLHIDPSDEAMRGWDPTDPDPANPYGDTYKAGTTIRTAAAQADWDAAWESGAWTGSITPADLQGWSHDSSLVGTAG